MEAALKEIEEAHALGADAIELRLDFLQDLDLKDPAPVLKPLLTKCKKLDRPAIATLRPEWEGYGASACFLPVIPSCKAEENAIAVRQSAGSPRLNADPCLYPPVVP